MPTTLVIILVMLGAAGLAAIALLSAGTGYSGSAQKENSLREDHSKVEVPEYRQENERGWLGEESRNVWRVQQSGAPEPAQPSRHWTARGWMNRPLTPQEEMEVRSMYARALDETLQQKLPDRHPLTMSRDPYASRQRGLGAYHPGLTRLEPGKGGEVDALPDSLPAASWTRMAHEAQHGIARRRPY